MVLFGGFTLGFDQLFEIIDIVGARTGTFAGLGEGALVGVFGGVDLFITYAGGDGNDIVLFSEHAPTGVPEPSALLLLGGGLIALGLARSRRSRRR